MADLDERSVLINNCAGLITVLHQMGFAHVWSNVDIRGRMKQYLVSFGTDYIRGGQITQGICTAFIVELESVGCRKKYYGAFMRRALDLLGERSVVDFFHKRNHCSCLKAKYKEMKRIPKMGMCMECGSQHERSKLMLCTRCGFGQYCNKESQVADWPAHKREECDKLCKPVEENVQSE